MEVSIKGRCFVKLTLPGKLCFESQPGTIKWHLLVLARNNVPKSRPNQALRSIPDYFVFSKAGLDVSISFLVSKAANS